MAQSNIWNISHGCQYEHLNINHLSIKPSDNMPKEPTWIPVDQQLDSCRLINIRTIVRVWLAHWFLNISAFGERDFLDLFGVNLDIVLFKWLYARCGNSEMSCLCGYKLTKKCTDYSDLTFSRLSLIIPPVLR